MEAAVAGASSSTSTIINEATQAIETLRQQPALKYIVPCVATGATIYLAASLWPRKRHPSWEWDLSAGLQAKSWNVYGTNVLKSHHAILGVVGLWGSGKTTVQKIFGAKAAPEKNRGIFATTLQSALVVESLGRGAPLLKHKVSNDEQEMTARFSTDIVTEIAHGMLLVVGDNMGLEDMRLMDEMKEKCKRRNIPLFVWHNIRRTNPVPTFRQRMRSLYPCDVDYSGCFDAPDDVCHLTGGIRAKLRMERVIHTLRSAAGGMPSVGTLIDKMENACLTVLPKYYGGVNSGLELHSASGDDSAASESPFGLHLTFKKDEHPDSLKRRWLSRVKNERAGHFVVEPDHYSEPLELRSLHGAKGLSSGWVPACCVYETTEPNGRIIKRLELEAPGVLFEDVEVQTTKMGIKVSMKKHVPYDDTHRTKIDEDGRSYGLFVRNFCFHEKDAIYQPVPPPEGLSMKDGVLSVRLWKVEMTKMVKKRTAASLAGDRASPTMRGMST